MLGHWVEELGLDRAEYSTHSVRRTKAALIYHRNKNLMLAQLLLGHSKLESTVRCPGTEVEDALEISEQTEIRVLNDGSPAQTGSAALNSSHQAQGPVMMPTARSHRPHLRPSRGSS